MRAYSWVLISSYALLFAWTLSGGGRHDPLGRPVGTDFASFWTVSRALLEGRTDVIYAPSRFIAYQAAVTGADAWYAWFYPPVALLLVAPLGLLPYAASFVTWCAVSLATYLGVLRRIAPGRETILVGAAFPAVFLALGHGQTSLLVTAALGAGLLLMETRPVAAGVLLGTMVVKPQLAVLVPLALVAGRRWRALAAAGASAALLVAVTLVGFGPGIWRAFLTVTPIAREALELGRVAHYKFQSTFAAVALLGGPVGAAYAVQAVVTCVGAAAVAHTWRASVSGRLRNAVLVCACVLATPFVLDYDLVMLALPAAWLVAEARERGWRAWEKAALLAAAFVPVVARPVGLYTGVLLGPVSVTALLFTIWRRAVGTSSEECVAGPVFWSESDR